MTEITKEIFGRIGNREVWVYTLTNRQQMSLKVMEYGAAILEWQVPDKNGTLENIVIGLPSLEEYVENRPFYGATVGRVAGRIAQGMFELDGQTYRLPLNQSGHHLHGGFHGLDTKVWTGKIKNDSVIFHYTDPVGSNGYPGTLHVSVSYSLTEAGEWKLHYRAETDQPTLFNPTNHVYFNLNGNALRPAENHFLQVNADAYAELGEGSIPTGELPSVSGTPFDFRAGASIRQATALNHPQTQKAGGLDHPFVLHHEEGEADAQLYEPESGRKITMTTDRDAVVIFLHNDASKELFIGGEPIPAFAGITLETQTLPDAINQEGFGNIVLHPGETFESETVFRFELMNG